MTPITCLFPSLEALLADAQTSDYWEEDAQEFLEDHHFLIRSGCRSTILSAAWRHGWRPGQ